MLRAVASAVANLSSPAAIGSTTPNSGAFTTLSTTGAAVIGGTLRTAGYTVSTLPAGSIGMNTFVTDALAPSFLVTVAGGGAIVTPVFFNGTNWITG